MSQSLVLRHQRKKPPHALRKKEVPQRRNSIAEAARYSVERLEGRILLASSAPASFAPYAQAANFASSSISDINWVAAGDLNKDGYADIVATAFNPQPNPSTAVEVLLSNGDGTFRSGPVLSSGLSPAGIVIGDFNGDGNADIAVANQSSASVSLFFGNGDGTFPKSANYNLPAASNAEPFGLAAADFDGNGKLDLAVTDENQNKVTVLQNQGNAADGTTTFGSTLNAYSLNTGVEPVGIVSFSLGGKQDLAVSEYGNSDVHVFVGNGDGTFTSNGTYPTATKPEGITAGDFNRDGYLDLAVTCLNSGSSSQVSILLGNPDGSFSPPAQRDYPVGSGAITAVVADFNGDGRLDFAAGSIAAVTVWKGNGDGTFSNSTSLGLPSSFSARIATGDFNGDHRPDIVAGDANATAAVGVLVNTTPKGGAPTASAGPPVNGSEGSGTHFNASGSSDPGGSLLSYTWDFGDSTPLVTTYQSSVSHIYELRGSYTATLTVADGFGTTSTGATTATIEDTPPAPSISGSASPIAHTPYTLALSGISVPADPILSWTINWGDGGSSPDLQTVTGNPQSVPHIYAATGPYTISAGIVDTDGVQVSSNTLNVNVQPDPYTVVNTNDSGPNSLRQAILDSNAASGVQTITFQIPGTGYHTIAPLSPLPAITDGAVIDGTSQPGYAGVPLIEISGTFSYGDGLTVNASNSSILGLTIDRFIDGAGLSLFGTNETIKGNFLGTNATGNAAAGNWEGLLIASSSNDTIGGTIAADRNVISGNLASGVRIFGSSTNNLITGNSIGMRAHGAGTVGNAGDGVLILGALAVGNTIEGNSIAGNGKLGIDLSSTPTYSTVNLNPSSFIDTYIEGASVGQQVGYGDGPTTGTGSHAVLWNGSSGWYVDLTPTGFTSTEAIDISGAQQVGFGDGTATGNLDHALLWNGSSGSFVDLNPSGFTESYGFGIGGGQQVGQGYGTATGGSNNALLWNGSSGSFVDLNPPGFWTSYAWRTSGGQQVGAGQLASGGGYRAVLWSGSNTSYVDLNPSGYSQSEAYGVSGGQQVGVGADPATNYYHAILWNGASSSYVDLNPPGFFTSTAYAISGGQEVGGGTSPGNYTHAILWSGAAASAIDLQTYLPANYLESEAKAIDADGNISGIASSDPSNGTWNALVWRVSGGDGVTPNTVGNPHVGPNLLQNFPEVTSAITTNGKTIIRGSVHAGVVVTYRVEFFSTPTPDSSGYGQGQVYMGSTMVRTDESGHATFAFVSPKTVPDGQIVTATATDASGNTSEFSADVVSDTQPAVQSITRTLPSGPITSASSVMYTVTFTKPVTGVDATDFSLALNGVTTVTPVVVSGSGAVYTVKINGISGTGTLGLNLVDNGSITDAAGNTLQGGVASFQTQQIFATGSGPSSAMAADVNSDGKLDLIVTNMFSNSVSVLLGNGDGTFQAQQTAATGANPRSLALADVNGDGKLDLISANANGNNLSVLLGNGDGTFQPQLTFATDAHPISVVASDVNGDGKPDVLVANYFGNTVSVLLGNGNGTFQAEQTLAVGATPYSIAMSDVNGDGKLDLLVTNRTNNAVSVLLGNGNGTFQARQSLATGSLPVSIVVSDVNADGRSDVLVANTGDNTVGVLLGNGDGTFQAQQTFAAGSIPVSLVASDLNSDGISDLAVINENNAGSVSILLGNGDGTFQAAQTLATGTNPVFVTVSDFNGDHKPDLAVANASSNNVSVLLDNSSGNSTGQVYTIQPLPKVLSISRASPPGPTTSDSTVAYTVTFNEPVTGVDPTDFALALNGVTAATPVSVSGSGAQYTVTISGISGTGTLGLNLVDNGSIRDSAGDPLQAGSSVVFQAQQTFSAGAKPVSLAVGDFNGDGTPDLVVANDTYPSTVSVLLGNGDGTFRVPQTAAVGSYPRSVTVADVNGDGKLDLLVPNQNLPATVGVLLGNGDGTFQAQRTFSPGGEAAAVAVADVNGDGKLDLVTANLGGTVGILPGNGDGTYRPYYTLPAGLYPESVAVADVNGDGKPDIVVGNSGGNTIGVMLGNGNGSFMAQQTYPAGQVLSVGIADVNADGKPDIVFVSSNARSVGVLLGNGNGTFQSPSSFATGIVPNTVAVADLNGDGKLDLAVANGSSNTISVLVGNGDGTFRIQQTFDVGSDPVSAAVSDLNGDGKTDLVVLNQSSQSVSVLLAGFSGNFTGQVYTIVQSLDTITGTTGADQIRLTQDADGQHIDWTEGSTTAQVLITDPSGLTINGNSGNDVITLDYTHGNPLPNTLHLNGTFTINGLSGANPFAGTTLEIGQSTVYVNYAGAASPASFIQQALAAGYKGGAWNGAPAGVNGAITSNAAASGPAGVFGVGYADSADGIVSGQPANTVEIRYTLMGDANLDRVVNGTDALLLGRNFMIAGKTAWDLGNFNFDATINLSDAAYLRTNFNAVVSGNVAAVSAAASGAAVAPAPAVPRARVVAPVKVAAPVSIQPPPVALASAGQASSDGDPADKITSTSKRHSRKSLHPAAKSKTQ